MNVVARALRAGHTTARTLRFVRPLSTTISDYFNILGLSKKRRGLSYAILDGPACVSPRNPVPEHIVRPGYAESGIPPVQEHMPRINDAETIEKISKTCKIGRMTLAYIADFVKPGVTTDELDKLCHQFIINHDGYPSPLNYMRFPKSVCTSVNNVTVHGIPDSRPLEEGDIISIDVTVYKDGVHGDMCNTFPVGKIDKEAQKLIDVAKNSVDLAIEQCRPGEELSVIGNTIEPYVDEEGFSVATMFIGHGVGVDFHMAPPIYPYANCEPGPRMEPGMVFTI
eukprot:Ihof_evm7s167 gene=Ihof_evmTU7s167